MVLQLAKRRFSVSEYDRMAEAGILGEDDRVELIDGEVVEMTPIGHRHAGCVKRLNRLFTDALGTDAVIGVQDPVVLGDSSEPQPDLAVLRPRADFYASAHPTPQDILLLIEVAETSAETDRRVKVPLYAGSLVQEVWVVDLQQDAISVYENPEPGGYRTVRLARRGAVIAPSAFPDRSFDVGTMLGG